MDNSSMDTTSDQTPAATSAPPTVEAKKMDVTAVTGKSQKQQDWTVLRTLNHFQLGFSKDDSSSPTTTLSAAGNCTKDKTLKFQCSNSPKFETGTTYKVVLSGSPTDTAGAGSSSDSKVAQFSISVPERFVATDKPRTLEGKEGSHKLSVEVNPQGDSTSVQLVSVVYKFPPSAMPKKESKPKAKSQSKSKVKAKSKSNTKTSTASKNGKRVTRSASAKGKSKTKSVAC